MDAIIAFADALKRAAEIVTESFESIADTVKLAVRIKAAYVEASIHNPEWVRQAKHNKRRRIRKKYHDRIMRKYGVAK